MSGQKCYVGAVALVAQAPRLLLLLLDGDSLRRGSEASG